MYSNSFLLSFGLSPDDFSRTDGPIESDEGFVYEAWEKRKEHPVCPKCGGECIIHNTYASSIRLRSDVLKKEILICHRIRYLCKSCGKTFTFPLKGAMVGKGLTVFERAAILAELNVGDTFSRVAAQHGISVTEVVNVFDGAYPKIEGKALPKMLCIDEFKFETFGSKYCCHLVDFETSETIDVIRSRQKAFLDEHFSSIDEAQRRKVRVVITDMYDEYALLARKWLPNATVVADRFHVVKQMVEAVNVLRAAAMKRNEKDTLAYNFMKTKWKAFLCRRRDIPDKWYTRKSDGCSWHYDELVDYCLKADGDLAGAYDCLQDVFALIDVTPTHEKALENIGFLITKMENRRCEVVSKVARTYKKWSNEIALGMSKNEFGAILSNGKMEAGNDVAQTMIDAAYGYKNFDRFGKRFLLMRWNKKKRR